MGLTHIRTPKNFDLDERIERYADAIERIYSEMSVSKLFS